MEKQPNKNLNPIVLDSGGEQNLITQQSIQSQLTWLPRPLTDLILTSSNQSDVYIISACLAFHAFLIHFAALPTRPTLWLHLNPFHLSLLSLPHPFIPSLIASSHHLLPHPFPRLILCIPSSVHPPWFFIPSSVVLHGQAPFSCPDYSESLSLL